MLTFFKNDADVEENDARQNRAAENDAVQNRAAENRVVPNLHPNPNLRPNQNLNPNQVAAGIAATTAMAYERRSESSWFLVSVLAISIAAAAIGLLLLKQYMDKETANSSRMRNAADRRLGH